MAPKSIRNIKLLVFFDYQLRGRVNFDMISLAFLNVNTPAGASFVYADGELSLSQNGGIRRSDFIKTDYNTSLLNTESSADLFLPVLLQKYNDRNETTVYQYNKPLVLPAGTTDTVNLNVKIRVPEAQDVAYVPGFSEVLKFAWVQYLSFLIPIGWLLLLFAKFLYSNQVLECSIVYERKKIDPT